MSQTDKLILGKIIRYCDDIASILDQIDRSFERYEHESVYQYALSMCLLQIGELVSHCSPALIDANPDIPWKYARAMRNLYAHDYGSARLDIVWTTLTEDIPAFRRQIIRLSASLEQTPPEE